MKVQNAQDAIQLMVENVNIDRYLEDVAEAARRGDYRVNYWVHRDDMQQGTIPTPLEELKLKTLGFKIEKIFTESFTGFNINWNPQ